MTEHGESGAVGADATSGNWRLDRAVGLFEFLGRAQQLKTKPARTTDAYLRDGQSVMWFSDIPEHNAITSGHRGGDPEPEAPLLTVDRVPRIAPPIPPERLKSWLTEPLDDPISPPTVRDRIPAQLALELISPDENGDLPAFALVHDQPEVTGLFNDWIVRWNEWAEQDLDDQPARELYGDLFSTYVTAVGHPEELELAIGLACLAWHPENHEPVRRHMLTGPATVSFDDESGRLTLRPDSSLEPLSVELDMLDPGVIKNPSAINEIREAGRNYEGHLLHREEIAALGRRLVHNLDANGDYLDEETVGRPSSDAVAAYAPALILRKRSPQGLVDIYRAIVAQLLEAGEVPSGLLPLVDPDHRPEGVSDPAPGAMVAVDDETFLPMPVNETQLNIIRNVDKNAQTLVQGPPGTGKTHTAAALLSHLLAQGKRVLVTAHTDRALYEVRDKLPTSIRPLSVAVVGSSRSDMSDLKVAVERISSTASEHDPNESRRLVESTLAKIDDLRRQRAEAFRRLIEARATEVTEHEHAGFQGSLAAIAQRYLDQVDEFGWITDYVDVAANSTPPVSSGEATEWLGALLDENLINDEPDARARLLEIDEVPSPEEFADQCREENTAQGQAEQHADLAQHEALGVVQSLPSIERDNLRQRMHDLAAEALELEQRREMWMNDALLDIRSNRATLWNARATQVTELIDRAAPLLHVLGPLTEITISTPDRGPLVALARSLAEHLAGGGNLKTSADGQPKIGALSPKIVKESRRLFDEVRVDSLPPTTREQLQLFLTFVEADKIADALDKAWPANVDIPPEDTFGERVQWHATELEQLRRVLALGARLSEEESRLRDLGMPHPDWRDLSAVHTYAALVDAASAREALTQAMHPLERLEEKLRDSTRWADAGACIKDLHSATTSRDHEFYGFAYSRLVRLHHVRELASRRDELGDKVRHAAPNLFGDVTTATSADEWNTCLPRFEAAWAWAATGAWILTQKSEDANVLQSQISVLEGSIRHATETLAATRAWGHAVSPERLTGQAQADLAQYAYLVRKLGKGTGKYAAQQRAEIRKAMDRCRPAVPVWIMPIYRIADQLRIEQNMFDVVIVDEASQAGLEATFLQYLAPKIVVIGDDRQVSPTAVGMDQQQLRDLANQFLAQDPYKATWQSPTRSLFDEAVMRFGSRITLTEHRRCMPEIIGFSNRVAYEPDGVRLIPVRQFGADRLEPIKAVFIRDGYTRGTTNKINPAEIDAVVDQIEKCLADPRYDGSTFGVISLLGKTQARAIEKRLLERIQPEEWAARDLRCGDAADFQGSERDVMFLSMVASLQKERGSVRSLRICIFSVTTSLRLVPRTKCGSSTRWRCRISATPKTCVSSCWTTATASSAATRTKTRTISASCPTTAESSRLIHCLSNASTTD